MSGRVNHVDRNRLLRSCWLSIATVLVLVLPIRSAQASPNCPPDWNNNGILDAVDLFEFLDGWFMNNGDYDGDGVTEPEDLFSFLDDWFAGCPVGLSATPDHGTWGTKITVTADPGLMPTGQSLADATISWTGRYLPAVGDPTDSFSVNWSGYVFATTQPHVVEVAVGYAPFSNLVDPSYLDAFGHFDGILSAAFPGGEILACTYTFTPETDAAEWRRVDYPDGPYGIDPPVVAESIDEIILYILSTLPNPDNPTFEQLLAARGAHCTVRTRIARNSITEAQAPEFLYVNIYSMDADRNLVDGIGGVPVRKDAAQPDPDYLTYTLEPITPVLFVDTVVDYFSYWPIVVMTAQPDGRIIVLPAH